jgi:hypothetical protein
MDNLKEVIGGIDSIEGDTRDIMTVHGGFTIDSNKKLKMIENNIVVGTTSKQFVKNKIIEWESFKNIYYVNGKLDPKHYTKLLEVLNYIFPFPLYTTDDNEIQALISKLYNAQPYELFNSLTKLINIHGTFSASVRHLFMSYKIYLENLIEIFVILREEYLAKYDLADNEINDFNGLLDRWNDIDTKNSVNTSSPILFFNFPPKKIKLDATIPKIHWKIKNNKHDLKNKNHISEINGHIQKFLDDIKKTNFNYIGFCPHVAIHRLLLLLKFPTMNLLNAIYKLDNESHKKYVKINISCGLTVKKIKNLSPQIKKMMEMNDTIKLTRTHVNCKNFTQKDSIKIRITRFEKLLYKFIKLYKDILPYLVKKEKFIAEISHDINTISKDIQHLAIP